jgi:2-hydroxyacyl-CoA lyase 1
VESSRLYCKYTARPSSLSHIPTVVEKAVRTCLYGRPGPVYIDMPGDLLNATICDTKIRFLAPIQPPPRCLPPPAQILAANRSLKDAKRPLIVIGKGAGYARAESVMRSMVEKTGLPFLPTPMGKGLVPDSHPCCVSSARSLALQKADVILVVGARYKRVLPHIHHTTVLYICRLDQNSVYQKI